MSELQPQPQARQAEEAVLGSVLIDPDAYFAVAQILTAGDFYIVRNRWVWEAFTALTERHTPIDYLTVCSELETNNRLGEVGGPAYLMTLINQTPSSLNAEAYAQLVAETATRRRLIEAANRIAGLGYDDCLPLDDSIRQAEQLLMAAGDRQVNREVTPLGRIMSRLYDQVQEAAQSGREFLGLPTGLIDLDNLLKGLQKGNLVVLAGRPGMGKTSLLLTIALNVGLVGRKRVGVFSLEMSEDEVGNRFLAQESGIDGQRLKMGKLREDEAALFVAAVEKLSAAPILVDDTPSLTPAQLRARCKRIQGQGGLDLVIVDYLQLMSGGGKFENRQVEVSFISRQLKALAKELNVPVLAAAQLSRAVEQRGEKRPQLSDLRESGGIEQDSDVVMFLFKGETEGQLSLEVAKQRNGPTGLVPFVYRPSITKFENASRSST